MDLLFKESVQKALNELSSHLDISLRALEKRFDVSYRTLYHRRDGSIIRAITAQPKQLLTPIQKEKLVQWILQLKAEEHTFTRRTISALTL
jgi:hypothetical protein